MPAKVTLLLGPAKSGKSPFLVDRYQSVVEHGGWTLGDCRNLWIGPTHATVAAVRDRLAATAHSAFLDPGVVTFDEFAERTIARSRRRIRPINRLQKQRILQNLLRRATDDRRLKYFGPVALTPGFLHQVEELIEELKRRDVWAEDFARQCRDQRDRDFAYLYQAYQHHLHEGDLYDAEGRFWAAREILGNEDSQETVFGCVVVDGFSNFTVAQRDILKLLSRKSRELHVSLTLEPGVATSGDTGRSLLFSRTQETLDLLTRDLKEAEIQYLNHSEGLTGRLRHAADTLFADEPSAANHSISKDPATIEVLSADSNVSEVTEVARRVKSLLFSGKARPEQIAVVFRTLTDVLPLVHEVFDDFGNPWSTEQRQSLITSPFVRTLLDLLSLHAEDWSFNRLLSVVGNRLVSISLKDSGGDDPPKYAQRWNSRSRRALERGIRRAQLPSGREPLCEQLRKWGTEDAEAQAAWQAASGLAGTLDKLPQFASIDEWIDTLAQLSQSSGLLPSGRASGTDAASRQRETDWKLLKTGLKSLAKVDRFTQQDAQELSVEELIRVLQLVAETGVIPAGSDDVGKVKVLSAEAARTISVEHMFLAGLAEQSFSSAERVGGIYSEREIDKLGRPQEAEQTSFTSDERRSGDMMFWFYELVTRPSKSLTLSYPALDGRGQPLPASPLLVELDRCFAPDGLPVTVVRQDVEPTPPAGGKAPSAGPPLSHGDFRLQGVAEALEGRPQWLVGLLASDERGGTGAGIVNGLECLAERGKFEGFGPYEGVLASPALRAALTSRFDQEHLWSASRLESYAACPFRFFSERLLRLKPLDDIALRSDHLRRGSLLHAVLARMHLELVRENREPGDLPTADDLVERFGRALQEIVAESPLEGLEAALREIEINEVAAWASAYAAQEVAYRELWEQRDQPLMAAHFEVRFGPKSREAESDVEDPLSNILPFEVDLGEEKVRLTGQIDRIDLGKAGGVTVFSIIDYKSGKEVKLSDAEILSGHKLQLPLYALATEKHMLADRKAVALAAGYWHVKVKGFNPRKGALTDLADWSEGKLTARQDWLDLVDGMKQRIGELVAGIRRGEFPVYNGDQKCTSSCDFSKICRIAQIRSLEKRWVAPVESEGGGER